MIFRAIELAKLAHKDQTRNDKTTPYIVHPARVAMVVSLLPEVDEEMIAAAWLHDVLEDTKVTSTDMIIAVGLGVTDLVRELTFDDSSLINLNYEQKKQIQNEHIAKASYRAKRIKILDRLDNLADFASTYENTVFNSPKKDKALRRFERYVKINWDLQELLSSQTEEEVDKDLVAELHTTLMMWGDLK